MIVEIDRVAAGGAGVGRLEDGMVVFVPRTAPGDRVTIELTDVRKRWAMAHMRSLEQAGPDRVDPECPHYVTDQCGGCQLQHVAIAAQLSIKAQIVGDALRRIARIECGNPPLHASPSQWRYRQKITLHIDEDRRIGLHPFHDPDLVFDLRDCLITNPAIMQLWRLLSRDRHLLPTDADRIVLSLGRDGLRHVVVRTRDPWEGEGLLESIGEGDVCLWCENGNCGVRQIDGPQTDVSPLSFEQSNPEVADSIRQQVVEFVANQKAGVAWDLYGGYGDTARLLADRGFDVWSVDRDRDVHRWAEGRDPHSRIHWVSAPAEGAFVRLPPPDVVIVNPPRTGMPAALCSALDDLGSARPGLKLGYVSCDPATLARDLARMPSLGIHELVAFDLFPHTSHVETAALLQARERP